LAYYPYDYDNVDTMHVGGLNAKWQEGPWTAIGDVSGSLTDTLGSYLGDYAVGSNIPLSDVNYSSSASGPATYHAGAPIGSVPTNKTIRIPLRPNLMWPTRRAKP
jgi:hypothetical protein